MATVQSCGNDRHRSIYGRASNSVRTTAQFGPPYAKINCAFTTDLCCWTAALYIRTCSIAYVHLQTVVASSCQGATLHRRDLRQHSKVTFRFASPRSLQRAAFAASLADVDLSEFASSPHRSMMVAIGKATEWIKFVTACQGPSESADWSWQDVMKLSSCRTVGQSCHLSRFTMFPGPRRAEPHSRSKPRSAKATHDTRESDPGSFRGCQLAFHLAETCA